MSERAKASRCGVPQGIPRSPASIPRNLRAAALAGITRHVAESAIEVIMHDLGYLPLWHFAGTGSHGIDLAMLGPSADRVIVLEVKGTLRPRRLPRLARGELTQPSRGVDRQARQPWHDSARPYERTRLRGIRRCPIR